ncbi:8938_t:CDS:2 [Diversispora eburnea]|uniref:8938_t:CDS:1 n=1 Tax=Diversispora eburnea TaxID=1213867 RepID=A0A9N9AW52_9GLOM|nr:8938_t:CDS:2 [Diversispora eburnea]
MHDPSERQIEQTIQKYQAKNKSTPSRIQQSKNAYYNQKQMLKEAQQNAYQTVGANAYRLSYLSNITY